MLKCHLPTWFILSGWGILDKLYQPASIHFRTSGGYHVGVLSLIQYRSHKAFTSGVL